MVYTLMIAVWLLGYPEPRYFSPDPARNLTIEECTALGREAVERMGSLDGVAGVGFFCSPAGDPI